ncbi:MAG: hypothetical protein ABEJ95_06245 [Candidatus Nanohalobium sp.]
MVNRKVIPLLLLAVVASGCTQSQGTGIKVTELDISPNPNEGIRAGNTVSISLEAVNAGLLNGTVKAGSNGKQVLTNYCSDIFKIESFKASSSHTSETRESYMVGENERVRFFWRLKQDKTGKIPLSGYSCPMRFELPFDYSVRAYKQVQVKKSREVSGSTKLATDISPGPLTMDMEIVGSTADQSNTILKQDNPKLYLTAYNLDSKESPYQGLIEIKDISIKSSGVIELGSECGKKSSVTLMSGDQKIFRCDIDTGSLSSPAERGEIEASIDYTFVKDIGERTVKVKYSGQ